MGELLVRSLGSCLPRAIFISQMDTSATSLVAGTHRHARIAALGLPCLTASKENL